MRRVFKRVAKFAPVKKNAGYRISSLRSFKQFKLDKRVFQEIDTCSFIRPYVVGETDGFELPEDIDLIKIKWTYVLNPGDLDHINKHMAPLTTHLGAIIFDMVEGERVHARVLLTQEQMETVRDSAKEQAHRR
jgi:hypothetical protein